MTNIATVVSARMGSRRLPGKALTDLGGVPMIQFLIERLGGSKFGGELIFATTNRVDDDVLAKHVAELGIAVFRGADSDVAGRYLAVANEFNLDWIVRVTGDCPFVDASSLDHCLSQLNGDHTFDMISTKGVFPVGIDYELFSTSTLDASWSNMSDEEKEHLTLRFYREDLGYLFKYFTQPVSWPKVKHRYVVDTPEDLIKARIWANSFSNNLFKVDDLLRLQD